MPVLRTSASDFTAWSRANAVLPTNGKAAKSTDTTVDRKAAAVVAIGSQSAIGATPSSAISKRWRLVPLPPVKATLTNSGSSDSFIVKYNSAGKVQWVAQQGGAGTDAANAVAVDSSGNVIAAGSFTSSTLTLYNAGGGGTRTLSATSGTSDSFIVKYDLNGNVLWAAQQGGAGTDAANAVAVDSSGNIIVGGFFSSTLTLYNASGVGTTTLTITSGTSDSFIAKYDLNGNVLWAAQQGGAGSEFAKSITVDSLGNIIVAGSFTSPTLTFYNAGGGGTTTLTGTSGTYDSFIAKYDLNGNVLWAAQQGGAAVDYVNAVAIDSSGNIIVGGSFTSPTLTLYNASGGGTTTLTGISGTNESFIAKYDLNGNVLWAAQQGGAGGDFAKYVTVDSSGNIIVAGSFSSATLTCYNAGGGGTRTLSGISGTNDSFIAKYDLNGNVLWAAQQGGAGTDLANAVAVDSSGNIIVGGYFSSATLNCYNAGGGGTTTLTGISGTNESFIAKYDLNGNVLWAAQQGGAGADAANAVAVDSSGNIIVGGSFTSPTLTCYNSDGTDIITREMPSSVVYYR